MWEFTGFLLFGLLYSVFFFGVLIAKRRKVERRLRVILEAVRAVEVMRDSYKQA